VRSVSSAERSRLLGALGIEGPEGLARALEGVGYLASPRVALGAFLALSLERPLLLEGAPGVGKTELAYALAAVLGSELVRLQCYEGIDVHQAVYDWDWGRQILHLRTLEALARGAGRAVEEVEAELFSDRFLVERAVLRALRGREAAHPPVLLVDEVDRADEAFEAYLLEVLSTWTVTIPEVGPQVAAVVPVVVLTSNRTRELHEALTRRCLYLWVDPPGPAREAEIVRRRVPEASERLARQLAHIVAELRRVGLFKPPGISETIDWAEALVRLGIDEVDEAVFVDTMGIVVKGRDDAERVASLGVGAILESRGPGDARNR
jgi:MoxR-like ATPase